MTEYELYDLLNSAQQTIIAISVAMVTQQSAYLVAIHFIGEKLGKLTLSLLITAYTLWLLGPLVGYWALLNRMMLLTNKLSELQHTEPSSFDSSYVVLVFVFIWCLTLLYTWHVRREVKGTHQS